jgi:sugar phosphate isomerase/epimerase
VLGPSDLVLSHYSLPRGTPFAERVAAAAAAGFAGIGWHAGEYAALRSQGWADRDLRRVLDAHGIVLHEVDALPLDRLALLDDAVALTTGFGAHHLQVQGNRPGSVSEAARVVAAIADRVADAAASVAIEFLGCNNIATATDALEIAELSERSNIGVQIDVWHHVRGANDWALLEAIPPQRIASVQIDDGSIEPAEPDYLTDTVHHRCVPGDGEFDLARFLAIFDGSKAPVPLSLEVIADDLLALPPTHAAQRIAAGARALIETHGVGRRGSVDPPQGATRPTH